MPSKNGYRAKWDAAHPWVRYVEWARRRCRDTKGKWFKYYGAKGITCDLTAKDLEFIWKRDNASALICPSLDRIKSELNYTKDNVRFIEFNLNARLAWDKNAGGGSSWKGVESK